MSSRKGRGRRGRGDQNCVVLDGSPAEEGIFDSDDEFFSCATSETCESVEYFSSEEDLNCLYNSPVVTPEPQGIYFVGDPKAALEDAKGLLRHAHDHPDDRTGYMDCISQLKLHMDNSSGILRVRSDFERALGTDTCRGMLTLLAVTAFNVGLLEDADMASRSLVHLYPNYELGHRIFKSIHEEAPENISTPDISPVLKSCLKSKPSPSPGKRVTFSRTKSVRMFEKENNSEHYDYVEAEDRPCTHQESPVQKKVSSGGWVPPSVRRKRLAEEQNVSPSSENDTIETAQNPDKSIFSTIKKFIDYTGSLKTLERVPSDASDASSVEPIGGLFDAAFDGNCEMVVECIESGCYSVNDKDLGGKTALMIAASNGNEEILRTLVEKYHADILKRDADGKTATMLAAAAGHMDIVRMLGEYLQA